MMVDDERPGRGTPHPDHPGWLTWSFEHYESFNAALGTVLVRSEEPGLARCRMFPTEKHRNLANALHGGAILAYLDIVLFAGVSAMGLDMGRGSVTLDVSTAFIGAGRLGIPLDSSVELLRETGRLVFLRGIMDQEGATVASWTATLRKGKRAA